MEYGTQALRTTVYFTSDSRETADLYETRVRVVPAFADLSAYFEFSDRERECLEEENRPMWRGRSSLENVTRRIREGA
jgi:hypothetical protein